MYAPKDAPDDRDPGNGRSYVKSHFSMVATSGEQVDVAGPLAIALIRATAAEIEDDNYLAIKCEDEPPYDPLVETELWHNYKTIPVSVDKVTHMDVTFQVEHTGEYWLVIVNCNRQAMSVQQGAIEWMNPYGHLSPSLFPYLPFYGWMCIVYLTLGCIWFIMCAMYWRDLVMLQNCISGVLGLCMVEMLCWYLHYLHLNRNGQHQVGPFIAGIMVSVMRCGLSRMLVLSVSLGWGVVRPSLGEDKCRIGTVGAIYFVFATLGEVAERAGPLQHGKPAFSTVILLFIVALIDAVIYLWVLIELKQLTSTLRSRRQMQKLKLYTNFLRLLFASFGAAVGFCCYQFYWLYLQDINLIWEKHWLLEYGFWTMLYSVLLFGIMFLWLPNKNNQRFAYAQLGTEDSDGDELEMSLESSMHARMQKSPMSVDMLPDPMFEIGDEDDFDFADPAATGKMS
jgi:GOST, seven transmembrane domain